MFVVIHDYVMVKLTLIVNLYIYSSVHLVTING